MATSQNGWSVLDTRPASITVPGTKHSFAVREGDVAVVLLEFLTQFHHEVESLDLYAGHTTGDEWGWAVRNVRGSSTVISNHASGTAVDVNAVEHPRGSHGTFTTAQVRKLRTLLAAFFDKDTARSIIRWGGDFLTTVDEMHFEINAGSAAVKRVADRIRLKHRQQAEEAAMPTAKDIAQEVLNLDVIPNKNAPVGSTNKTWSLTSMVADIEDTQDRHTAALHRVESQLAEVLALLSAK